MARKDGLEVQSFHEELLVYDLRTDRAHVLHPVVASMWQACDGERSVAELVASVRASVDPSFDSDGAWAALDALWDADLLMEKPAPPVGERRLSRRDLIRDVAAAGALGVSAGAVRSILVPMPLEAQSGGGGDAELDQKEMEAKTKQEPPEEEKKEEPPEEEEKEEEKPEEEKPEEEKKEEPPEEEKKGGDDSDEGDGWDEGMRG